MNDLMNSIRQKALMAPKRIVLPEGTEERTIKAANEIIKEGFAHIILIGNRDEILHLANEYYLDHIKEATIVDPMNNPKKEQYIALMMDIRKDKGLTYEQAAAQIENPLYLGAVMIKAGDADGEVAGAKNYTGDVLRPAFQYVKTLPGISVVSGAFVMLLQNPMFGDNGKMIFSDCAVNPDPTAQELAQIAVMTGRTARSIVGMEPRIAMLSFSTHGSANHPKVDKVIEATRLAKEMDPTLIIDGELQADSAIIPGIAAKKAPDSKLHGRANILIFPSLDVGNIAYKLVQRTANAEAIGPILQGMAAPINDLSRGCSVDDIVNLVAITVCQAVSQSDSL